MMLSTIVSGVLSATVATSGLAVGAPTSEPGSFAPEIVVVDLAGVGTESPDNARDELCKFFSILC